jgi:hypothetical protein
MKVSQRQRRSDSVMLTGPLDERQVSVRPDTKALIAPTACLIPASSCALRQAVVTTHR